MTEDLSADERAVINVYQQSFPLTARPFASIGATLGMSEAYVLQLMKGLDARGILSRIGAVVEPNRAGASTLAAMGVPRDRLEEVAALVSAHPEVNHNYEREHTLNLWFVATASDAKQLDRLLSDIAEETGIEVVDLPLIEAYHIDLGFPV